MAENGNTEVENNNSGETESVKSESEQSEWKPPATQQQLDRIIRDRLNREREKYADYAEAKKKAEEFDKLQEASRTDLEKAQARAQELEEKATKAEQKAMQMAIRSAVINEASKQKALSPEAVYKLIDSNTLTVEDDGTVKGVSEAVTALLEENTFLVGNGFTGNPDGGQRGSGQLTHKRSDIADPKYFQEHRADILAAQAEPGRPRISND